MIKELRITFGGSFQCRLATDGAAPDASPRTPFDSHGNLRGFPFTGWTYSFQENSFDRVIRLGSPVHLRNALLYKWSDTIVNRVEVDRGRGFLLTSDALVNTVLSLGNAKFDAAAGRGATFEKLIDFKFSLGNVLTADANPAPQLNSVDSDPEWQLEYLMRKPPVYIQATNIDATRRKVFDFYEPVANPPFVFRDW